MGMVKRLFMVKLLTNLFCIEAYLGKEIAEIKHWYPVKCPDITQLISDKQQLDSEKLHLQLALVLLPISQN